MSVYFGVAIELEIKTEEAAEKIDELFFDNETGLWIGNADTGVFLLPNQYKTKNPPINYEDGWKARHDFKVLVSNIDFNQEVETFANTFKSEIESLEKAGIKHSIGFYFLTGIR